MKKYEVLFTLVLALVILSTFTINSYHTEIRKMLEPRIVTASEEQPELKEKNEDIYKPLNIWTSKKSYYRYELVDVFASLKDLEKKTIPDAIVTAKFYYKNKLIKTITDMVEIEMRFNPASGLYEGKWPIPWNPPLGDYSILVTAKNTDPSPVLKEQHAFRIAGREPPTMPDGFSVMALETFKDLANTTMEGPDGKKGDWRNIISWAKYMGADAVFSLAGMTDGNIRRNPDGSVMVFRPDIIKFAHRLAGEAKKQGIKYGAWVMSFMIQAKNFEPYGYASSIDYNEANDILVKSYHISLADKKRLDDIVDIVKGLDKDPNIDFIGIDYIRTGNDGYELVDEVIDEMSISVPANWKEMGERDRIIWFARKIKVEKNADMIEKWQWWRAHKTAMNVAEIIERSGTSKPVWAFSLGWEHGKQHGQDPIMFNDAGITYDAVMLYEANQMQYRSVLIDWKKYLKARQVNIICGNSVDVTLLDSSNLTAPEEMVRRSILGSKQLLFGGMTDGIFWHDLSRALWGRKGEFSTKEWCLTGAVSISKYKAEKGLSPVAVKINTPDSAAVNVPFIAKVRVENISLDPVKNITITIEQVEGIKELKNKTFSLEQLNPGEAFDCSFDVALINIPEKARWNMMIPVKVSYGDEKNDYDFAMVKSRKRNRTVITNNLAENKI